jgi:hypothetical protein
VEVIKIDLQKEINSKDESINELKGIVKVQGEKIAETAVNQEQRKGNTLKDVFKSEYDKIATIDSHDSMVSNGKRIILDASKASVSTEVMSVNTVSSQVFPTAGSTGVLSSGLTTFFGNLLGYFEPKRSVSMIMGLVDVLPLDNYSLIVVDKTITGTATIGGECTLKPTLKMTLVEKSSTAQAAAAKWYTTTALRRYFPRLANMFQQTFSELVNEVIPNDVLTFVKNSASAFTPNTLFQISTTPNNYDALGAVIASLENLNFVPNGIVMNPIAWRNMKQSKGTDGHYNLANGGSIMILENGIEWGGFTIPIVKDTTLAVDEFMVGDFKAVKVGVDNELIYFETDGRTDDATIMVSSLSVNVRTHLIEKFVAKIVPDTLKTGIIKDTFTNVKTLITKP